MKHVYIVEVVYDYESKQILGVFDNKLEADKAVECIKEENPMAENVYYHKEKVYTYLEDWEEEL